MLPRSLVSICSTDRLSGRKRKARNQLGSRFRCDIRSRTILNVSGERIASVRRHACVRLHARAGNRAKAVQWSKNHQPQPAARRRSRRGRRTSSCLCATRHARRWAEGPLKVHRRLRSRHAETRTSSLQCTFQLALVGRPLGAFGRRRALVAITTNFQFARLWSAESLNSQFQQAILDLDVKYSADAVTFARPEVDDAFFALGGN